MPIPSKVGARARILRRNPRASSRWTSPDGREGGRRETARHVWGPSVIMEQSYPSSGSAPCHGEGRTLKREEAARSRPTTTPAIRNDPTTAEPAVRNGKRSDYLGSCLQPPCRPWRASSGIRALRRGPVTLGIPTREEVDRLRSGTRAEHASTFAAVEEQIA